MRRMLEDMLAGSKIRVYYNQVRCRYELQNMQWPEVGARMLAAFVRIGVEVVEQFKQIDTRCDAAEDRPQTGIGIPSSSKAAHPWSGA